MPGPVKLVVDADMAKAFSAFTKLVEHQTRAEKGMEKLAAAGDRADRAATAATQKMVARVQATTRGAEMAVSQADRVAMKAGFDPGGGALGTAIARRAAAGDIKLGRAQAGYDSARSSFIYTRSLGERMDREAKMAREAVANERAMFSGNVAAYGGFGRTVGESRLQAGARQYVAGRVASTPGLSGRVSPQDMENMVQRRASQVQQRWEMADTAVTGVVAGATAAAGFMHTVFDEWDKNGDRLVELDKAVAPFVGVGENYRKRAQLVSSTLQQSAGTGIDYREIAKMGGAMEGAFSDMPAASKAEAAKGAMQFNRLQGSDMTQTALALGASQMILGDRLAPGAEGMVQMKNKLMYSSDIGGFNPDNITPYLPRLLNSFQAMHYSPDEALAAASVVSRQGLPSDVWATAESNIPLLFSHMQKKGLKRSGDFGKDLAAAASLKDEEAVSLFGQRTFAVAEAIAANLQLFNEIRAKLETITGKTDLVAPKLAGMLADPSRAASQTIQALGAGTESDALRFAQSPEALMHAMRAKAAARGAATHMLPFGLGRQPGWMQATGAWLGTTMPWTNGWQENQDATGLKMQLADFERAGDVDSATFLKTAFGETFGSSYTDDAGKRRYTGIDDAERLMKFRAHGFKIGNEEYRTYLNKKTMVGDADEQYMRGFRAPDFFEGITYPAGIDSGPGEPFPNYGPWEPGGSDAAAAAATAPRKQSALPEYDRAANTMLAAAHVLTSGARDTGAHAY